MVPAVLPNEPIRFKITHAQFNICDPNQNDRKTFESGTIKQYDLSAELREVFNRVIEHGHSATLFVRYGASDDPNQPADEKVELVANNIP